jgi:hypothetical protein
MVPEDVAGVAELFDLEPLQSLGLIRTDEADEWVNFQPVLVLPQLTQLRALELVNIKRFEDDEYQALLHSPALRGINKLSFRGSAVQPHKFEEMMYGNTFSELVDLNVADITNLGPSLQQAFLKATHRNLKCLDASRVILESEHWQQILASQSLSNVEQLRLGFAGWHGQRGPLFELDIGWVIPWSQLMLLDLEGQRLGDDAVRAITAHAEAGALRWLGLAHNDLGQESIRLLLNSTNLGLTHLDLRGNRLTPTALAALKQRFPDAQIIH